MFRIVGRDDQQGIIGGDYLAEHWRDKKIAILHDGEPYGAGIAAETRRQLSKRGMNELLYEQIIPGEVDTPMWCPAWRRPASMSCTTGVMFPRRPADTPGSGARLRRAAGFGRRLVERGLLVHRGSSGRRDALHLLSRPEPRARRRVDSRAARARQIEPNPRVLYSYGAVQAWAAAVERAGSLDPQEVSGHCAATSSTPC